MAGETSTWLIENASGIQSKYYNMTLDGNFTQAVVTLLEDATRFGTGVAWVWAIMYIATLMTVYLKTENLGNTLVLGVLLFPILPLFPLELVSIVAKIVWVGVAILIYLVYSRAKD